MQPAEDPRDRPTTEGTHPLAMVSLVCGIAGVATSSCICFYPPVAPWLSGVFGLASLGLGVFGSVQVKRGRWHDSNRFQLRLGLGLGALALLLAGLWIVLLTSYGAGLGVSAPEGFAPSP